MTHSSAKTPSAGKLSARTTLILAGLVFSYILLQPSLERWLGVELPSLTDELGQVADNAGRNPEEPPPVTSDHNDDTLTAPSTDRLGELHETDNHVFVSTAGLRYRPGSQEGHRIDHVLRHSRDDTSRPVHGVFDGDRDEILSVIDEAYLISQERGPPDVQSEKQDGRTVWTVDLGRRIGFVGGQSGQRKNRPAAHHVKLILENGNNVISAYPVRVSGF